MTFAAGYALDLYCDGKGPHEYGEFPHQYNGETFGECARQARRAGWLFRRDGMTVLCPKCSGKRPERRAKKP